MASMSSSSGAVTSGILDGKVPVFVFPVQVRLSITRVLLIWEIQ